MEAFDNFPLLRLRMTVAARQMLKLPAQNKGNTLRGAFGTQFRQLVCVPECPDAHHCPLDESASANAGIHPCPYRELFEPAPPKWAGRLSRNQDAPRPFVFRPPKTAQTTWQPGETFDFELLLFGRATRSLPWFVLTFRTVLEDGFGLNRAACELRQVASIEPDGSEHSAYEWYAPLLREAPTRPLADWIVPRVNAIERALPSDGETVVRIDYLTPTLLKANAELVRAPEFHHLFKRIRDRVNALSTFYGAGPIDADFAELGRLAESARTRATGDWQERSRRSSRTGQRHPLSGFVGHSEAILPRPAWTRLLPWLAAGELLHAGRHTVWGGGEVRIGDGCEDVVRTL